MWYSILTGNTPDELKGVIQMFKFFKKNREQFFKIYFRSIDEGKLYMVVLDRVGYNNFMIYSYGYEILGVDEC